TPNKQITWNHHFTTSSRNGVCRRKARDAIGKSRRGRENSSELRRVVLKGGEERAVSLPGTNHFRAYDGEIPEATLRREHGLPCRGRAKGFCAAVYFFHTCGV
ncbi:unnamed protein product, partial [Ectocarpus sp. 12 AP-2014]